MWIQAPLEIRECGCGVQASVLGLQESMSKLELFECLTGLCHMFHDIYIGNSLLAFVLLAEFRQALPLQIVHAACVDGCTHCATCCLSGTLVTAADLPCTLRQTCGLKW